jgi:hypothetical protein
LERVLVGGYGDSGIQLRPDDGGAHPSAGKRQAAATAERTGVVGDGLQINSRSFIPNSLIFGSFYRIFVD